MRLCHVFYTFMANVQNICNLIGRQRYNIGLILLSVLILCSVKSRLDFLGKEIRNFWIKNKLVINAHQNYLEIEIICF